MKLKFKIDMGKCNMVVYIIKDIFEVWGYDFKLRIVIMIMFFSVMFLIGE